HFTSVYLYLLILPPPPEPPLFPSTTLFRSPGSIAFSGRRFDRTLCSKRHTEMVRPTVHWAVSKTDPTPRRAVLLEADQLRRAHDDWGVRFAGRLAHERLENRETADDRHSGTTGTGTGATHDRIGMCSAHLPGPLAGP